MTTERRDFEVVARLDADAVGRPGQRRFRVIAQNETETAFLWLEKEQLQALGLAVDQLLANQKALWSRSESTGPAGSPPQAFDGAANFEFRVGRLGLGFDETSKRYVLIAHDLEGDADDPPTFRCLCTRGQLSRLSETITALIESGRPRCPLCGAPLDQQPHFCPGSNGHAHH
ncbi:MAG TPA: DUF3090 family protein [Chloroflexota bacterium]|nr:DUF3090 family protein [Chloroflexota bacterium]